MNLRPVILKFVIPVAAIAALLVGLYQINCSSVDVPIMQKPVAAAAVHDSAKTEMSHGETDLFATRVQPKAGHQKVVSPQRRVVPADETLTKAYPEIKTAVADWKEHNRQAKSITVAPFADMPIGFERVQVNEDGKYVTWFGTNREVPGSSLISVATPNGSLSTLMIIPGTSQFSFYTEPNGRTFISEAQPGEEGCEVPGVQPNRTAQQAPTTAELFKFQYQSVANSYATGAPANFGGSNAPVQGAPAAATGDTIYVDVLMIYDADCLQTNSPEAIQLWGSSPPADIPVFLDARAKTYIDAGNVVLNNSLITNFQWRYLGSTQAAAYTRPANSTINFDLAAISPGGLIGTWVAGQAYTRGADQVVLIRGNSAGAVGSGIAQSATQSPTSGQNARSAVVINASYKAMIHEFGHNFGAQHDREHAVPLSNGLTGPVADNTTTTGPYCYGQLWSIPDTIFGGPPGLASTLMGYGSAVIPYFSNPNITARVNGALAQQTILGDWGDQALGRVTTDPKAAYNAKVLSDNAAAMAAGTEEISTPVITAQPQNTTVVEGNSLSLSVTVSGGGLAYQWFKGTTAISGATSPTYSKTSGTGDAGNYTVTASNSIGSVTSNVAAVTVNAAPVTPPTPPPSGGGGGGGGGGAPSTWFLGAIVLLSVVRKISRHNRD